MKKILLSTALAASLATASDYNFEITPMIGGVFTEGNLDLDRDYANAGLSFGINTNTFFDQIELGFLTTIDKASYENSTQETNVTRYFTNIVKNYKINEEVSLYALAGIGYENFSNEQFNNEDSAFGNYGFGIKYNITDYFALKADVRHLIETDHGDNNLLYNFGLGISFGEKAKPAPIVEEPKKEEPKPTPVVKKVEAPKDSDKDGVIDPKDECPATPAGLLVDAVGCTVLVDLNINFATDSAQITNQYNEKIVEFANLLNKDTQLKATINAHTDSTGSEKYNQTLSQKRAESAVEALKNLNVDPTRVEAKGFGESQPIATNSTKEGRAANRRVEATLERIK